MCACHPHWHAISDRALNKSISGQCFPLQQYWYQLADCSMLYAEVASKRIEQSAIITEEDLLARWQSTIQWDCKYDYFWLYFRMKIIMLLNIVLDGINRLLSNTFSSQTVCRTSKHLVRVCKSGRIKVKFAVAWDSHILPTA